MVSREDVKCLESASWRDVGDGDGYFAGGFSPGGRGSEPCAAAGQVSLAYRVQHMAQTTSFLLAQWIHRVLRCSTRDRWPPFVGASAVVERDGAILMLARSDGLGLSLPGGLVKSNETVEAALWREVLEETGYEIVITDLLDVYSDPWRDPRIPSVEIAYVAAILKGEARASVEGTPKWVRRDHLPRKLAFDHERVIADYFRQCDRICRDTQSRCLCVN